MINPAALCNSLAPWCGAMEIGTHGLSEKAGAGRVHSTARTLVSRPSLLKWITVHELEALRDALARGGLPPDFLGKLKRMTGGDLTHHHLAVGNGREPAAATPVHARRRARREGCKRRALSSCPRPCASRRAARTRPHPCGVRFLPR